MYVPNTDPNSIDDKDVMGVFIAPSSHYIGTKKVKDTREKWYKEWDCVHYELLKLAGLLEKGNPNVLSLLWLNDRYVIHRSPEWDFLVSNRDAFSSKAVYHSFVGYAHGQLHRMTHMSFDGYMGEKRKALVEKYGYDCYDETTEFLTNRGWLYFDDIKEGDSLATINGEARSEFQRPLSRIDKPYTGMMYTLEPHSSRAIVTENHNLLVSPARRNRNNNFSVEYDEELSDWKLLSLRSILDGRRSHFHIRRSPEPKILEYPVDDSYLKLSGLYLSEGSTNYRDEKVKSIRLVQSKSGIFWKIADEVSKAFPFKRYDSEKETQWVAHGETARAIHEDFGHAKLKHLPEWCFQLSFRQSNVLWESLMAGDGTKKAANDCYFTTVKKLADDIQACMILAGHPCVVYGPYYRESNMAGQEGKVSEIYQVVRSNISESIHDLNTARILHFGQIPKNKEGYPVKENYVTERRVVCFEVPNGTLITRNRGAVAIHGNCKNAAHLIRLLRMGIEFLTEGILYVERTNDATQLLEIKHGEWSLDSVKQEAERLFTLCQEAYIHSPLPPKPDSEKINTICIELLQSKIQP
jgi:predicted nucleotidyltransferase